MPLNRAEPPGLALRNTGYWASVACVLAAMGLPSLAVAQSNGVLQPNAAVSVTATDNVNGGPDTKSADILTRLSAGVGYSSRSGLLVGRANYAISQLLYARTDERNALQHSLLANLSAEVLPSRGFVDLTASVAQSAKSAFGTQPTNDGRESDNITELASVGVAPRLSGLLFGQVAYSLSGAYRITDASGTTSGDTTLRSAALVLSPASAGRLSWNVGFNHQLTSYKAGRSTETDSVNVGAGWQVPEADLSLRASTGREVGDLASSSGRGGGTWSAGATWVPSPRTSVDATFGERPSGNTYQLGLSYRTPLTVWRVAASRNLSSTLALSSLTLGTNYDLYFALFAASEPDPVKRDVLVENYLRANGIPRDGLVRGSFLSSAQTLDERLELSSAWRHARSSVTVSLSRNLSRRVGGAVQATGDLAQSSQVRMNNVSLNLSHQLAPDLSTNLGLGANQSRGDLSTQSSRARFVTYRLGGSLSPRTSWSVSARRSLNETGARSYSESSLTGTYSMQF
ncbi:TIGR03016 family PEP-CTERM system-associated outer membrane protein [Aquabacterium sp. OR-4]|uniref:TIGR03016 family PEP-CTERM system-associated outer membrane protein n=1 Tax=Aquabacterium sp. OR-4 TaxID=2978127 RepID=UPI0021B4D088|nr:TIGR03016 family PEP-CTERM system-associated outer membrane protein [Aquabacterium sp. OR-4]MDT7837674.1 TIGR03016 family PEP-CTERM system-associated outer membrane protein [Aquabacterium sp. OR-4]